MSKHTPTPANACLISAAPEMYEALAAFDKWWRLPTTERTIEAIEPAMRMCIEAKAKAERDECRDKAEVAYAEGWPARVELADKAKAEAEAEAGWMAKQEYDGGGAAYHQGFQDGVASCANKQLAKQLAKLKAERDEWKARAEKAEAALRKAVDNGWAWHMREKRGKLQGVHDTFEAALAGKE